MKNLKVIAFTVLLFNFLSTYAQDETAERKSKNSLRAPGNIKIDGKLNEWGGKLKAYSTHTQFYYTVSNDDKYLYLTVQARYKEIIARIIKGGITLTVNKSGTKKDTASICLTYPLIERYYIRFSDAPSIKKKDAQTLAKLDTFASTINYQLASKTKFIRVSGIKSVDTLISVYNLDGIKAAVGLDNELNFNYELAVSLKELRLDNRNTQKLVYQVMINETPSRAITGVSKEGLSWSINGPSLEAQPATDFWGEYSLAKW